MSDWTMKGLDWDNPLRIRSATELTNWVQEIGFLPFFANEVTGFSVEEHTASHAWWTGNKATDPWEWREEIAASHTVAYGKFFDGRAGCWILMDRMRFSLCRVFAMATDGITALP